MQTGKIVKFSETCVRNYWGKPKNCNLAALIEKKITDNRLSFVALPFTKNVSKAEKIILNNAEKYISNDKKFAKFLITSFQTLPQT